MRAGRLSVGRLSGARRWAAGLAVLGAIFASAPAKAEVQIQVYGGVNANFSSDVQVRRPTLPAADGTYDVDWDGKPFEMPPYWGARAIYWLDSNPRLGRRR